MDGSNRERVLVQPGWVGPWGIAATPSGTAYLVDGLSLASLSPAGQVARIGGPLDKSAPRFVRALASTATGQVLMTTARGDVLLYDAHTEKARPLAEKLGQLKGVCEGANGEVFVVRADRGAAADGKGSILRIDAKGQVMPLVQNLSAPSDVAVWRDYCLVSETGARRLIAIDKDGTVTVVRDGLQNPRGMTILGDTLYLLDRGSRSLWSLTLTADLQDPAIRANDTQIATRLPVGAHCPLDFAGGLCASHDGGLLIAADGEGSVLSLRPA
jgi:hypothetical protein